ncbi:MAG: S8 family serine peptidase [Bacillota bacterium]
MKRILWGVLISGFSWSNFALAQMSTVIPGEYIVKMKSQSGMSSQRARAKLSTRASMKASFPAMGMYHVSLNSAADPSASLEDLKKDPDVEYIEPNYKYEKFDVASSSSSGSGYTLQTLLSYRWVSSSSNIYSQFSQATVTSTQVVAAWSYSAPLSQNPGKVIVAIVDSGLDSTHPVFQSVANGGTGALWSNDAEIKGQTGVDDDGNGYVDDKNGWNFISNTPNFADDNSHGTHVSGIVVGAGLNIFASPLDESKILVMPLKFLAADGTGSTANAIKAINYAVNNGAQIINNSWGGSNYSQALADAFDYAYQHQVLVVSAAGNYNSNNDSVAMYPANYSMPSNMAVASTTGDLLSSFSNYGATTVAVGSPGEDILSTVPGGTYNYMSGTSMATPFVAGIAALALRENPSLTGYQLKQKVMQTVDSLSALSGKVSTSGRVDSANLIQSVQSSVGVASYQPDYTASRAPASDAAGGAAGCGLVKSALSNGPGTGGPNPTAGVVAGLLMLPMLVWFVLRQRAAASDPKNQRRYERFKMSSQISVKVGDRELVGSLNTISQGGLSFNTDHALEKGGVVTMRIQSPDGHEVIEVQGQVVWSEANQSYGVQFANARQGTLAMIQQWTADLVKSS